MLKQADAVKVDNHLIPAAFGRLCVETRKPTTTTVPTRQPPSGGCVLKLIGHLHITCPVIQPPSGGCVLKLTNNLYE